MIVRIVEPPEPIVTWEEAKKHLRVRDGEQDYVEALIAAAQDWFDGPNKWLGHSFGLQTYDLLTSCWTEARLPYGPIVEIVSVTYRDKDGVTQTMPEADYRLLSSGALYAETWPETDGKPEAITVRVRSGYAPALVEPEGGGDPVEVSTVPASAKQALLLIIGHWFANRETVVTGTIATEVPMAAEALLAPFKSWRA